MTDRKNCPSIVVLGDLLLDTYLWGNSDRISPEAPVPVVHVTRRSAQLGGAGNVVGNLRSLGAEVVLITAVGDDPPASALRELLEDEGVDAGHLLTAGDRQTPEKTRVIAANQQMLRYDQESTAPVEGELEEKLLTAFSDALDHAGAAIISDYGKGVVSDRLCAEAVAAARQRGLPILCDPKGADFSKYRGATAITPNKKEASLAAQLSIDDQPSLSQAGELLKRQGDLDFLLMTLGRDGMVLFGPAGLERISTTAQEIFDVSGAGDTVIAALTYGLATSMPLADACRFANAAAGVVVGKFGAARVTLEEIACQRRPSLTRQSTRKVLGLDRLLSVVARAKRAQQRVVFTNGCYDLIHAGHIKFLEDAAALGDLLIVGLNSDASIRRLKGADRPIQDARDRAALLAALQAVDYVVLFDDDTPLALIQALQPDVLAKGQDYRLEAVVGAELVQSHGGEVALLPIMADRSTSLTIKKIVGQSR